MNLIGQLFFNDTVIKHVRSNLKSHSLTLTFFSVSEKGNGDDNAGGDITDGYTALAIAVMINFDPSTAESRLSKGPPSFKSDHIWFLLENSGIELFVFTWSYLESQLELYLVKMDCYSLQNV